MKSNCYLDANFLVYLGNSDSPLNPETVKLLDKLIRENFQIILTSLTLDEYVYAVLKEKAVSRIEALTFIRQCLKGISDLPKIRIVNPPLKLTRHFQVLGFIQEYKLKPRNAYHLLVMKENKIKYFATFDNDFKQVFKVGKLKKFTSNDA